MLDKICIPHHDWFTALLTSGLILGLVVSYAPQHYRIIHAGSSEGFSPLFLFLGATASAAGLFNMITMQWGVVKCCPVVGFGPCVEMTAGIFLVGMQWFLFNATFVLYMIYYPPLLKYTASPLSLPEESGNPPKVKMSPEWRASVWLAWLTVLHFAFHLVATFYILLLSPPIAPIPPSPLPSPTPPEPLPISIAKWATWCGISSAVLSAIQYAPQLTHTYRVRLVGALSIPMMCIQSPGAVAMVLSIALRPGTNWTSWIMYAVSGIMQGMLLIICIFWTIRQKKLGVDDFGRPVDQIPTEYCSTPQQSTALTDVDTSGDSDSIPCLVSDEVDTRAISKGLSRALDSAMGSDLRLETSGATEQTPLMVASGQQVKEDETVGWRNWIYRK